LTPAPCCLLAFRNLHLLCGIKDREKPHYFRSEFERSETTWFLDATDPLVCFGGICRMLDGSETIDDRPLVRVRGTDALPAGGSRRQLIQPAQR